MSVPEISIIGTMFIIIGFVLGNARIEAKKRSRIYERIDEHKNYTDGVFVRKDMCGVLHKNLSDKVDRIDRNIEKLLNKNGIK